MGLHSRDKKVDILKCDHEDCGNIEKIWLPFMLKEAEKGLKSHPFCIHCGMVKNIGSDKARSTGYYLNILARMEKSLKTPGAKVRMRLVARELEASADFDDTYSMSGYAQERIFTNIVKKYFQIPESIIQSFI